jgi:NADH:ubiquinone oxidoreductase subunit D
MDVYPKEKGAARIPRVFSKRVSEYEQLLSENRIWLSRTVGIGIIDEAAANKSALQARFFADRT